MRFRMMAHDPWGTARPDVLRARGLRVLNLGLWMVIYTPRNHWSNDL